MPRGVYERTERHREALRGIKHTMTDTWKEALKVRRNPGGGRKGCPPYNAGKKRPELSGEKHPNWKGGITTEERKQRLEFRTFMQKKVFERDNYTCVICSHRGGNLQVDHIKSWSQHPELRFDISNCQTLCMGCHYRKTFNKEMPDGTVWGHNLKKASL